ncbi:MAG: hypothetical protein NW206_02870 [Hyphomonadaceae bacterium]|nr:hypothetical protein [Hyphomonadaceae bacterium]
MPDQLKSLMLAVLALICACSPPTVSSAGPGKRSGAESEQAAPGDDGFLRTLAQRGFESAGVAQNGMVSVQMNDVRNAFQNGCALSHGGATCDSIDNYRWHLFVGGGVTTLSFLHQGNHDASQHVGSFDCMILDEHEWDCSGS